MSKINKKIQKALEKEYNDNPEAFKKKYKKYIWMFEKISGQKVEMSKEEAKIVNKKNKNIDVNRILKDSIKK